MRKVFAAILAVMFALLLCACGAAETVPADNQAPSASQLAPNTTAGSEAATTDGATTEATTESTAPSHTHSYGSATCTDPATCETTDPDYAQVSNVWIPTNGGKKYHKSASCSNMKNPEEVTQSEAESRGFTPCKRCY